VRMAANLLTNVCQNWWTASNEDFATRATGYDISHTAHALSISMDRPGRLLLTVRGKKRRQSSTKGSASGRWLQKVREKWSFTLLQLTAGKNRPARPAITRLRCYDGMIELSAFMGSQPKSRTSQLATIDSRARIHHLLSLGRNPWVVARTSDASVAEDGRQAARCLSSAPNK
jgi:hypothetical protein